MINALIKYLNYKVSQILLDVHRILRDDRILHDDRILRDDQILHDDLHDVQNVHHDILQIHHRGMVR